MMKKLPPFLISLLIGIGLLVWIIDKIGWQQIWEAFRGFSIWSVFILLGLSVLIVILGSWKWQVILRSQGTRLAFRKVAKAYLIGFSLDYLTPIALFGGEVIRSYTLKEKEDSLSWEKIIASIGIDKILDCIFIFLIVSSGLLLFNYRFGLSLIGSKIIIGVSLSAMVISALLYLKACKKESVIRFFLRLIGLKNSKGREVLLGVEKEIFAFFRRKKLLAQISLLTFLRFVAFLIRHWILMQLLGMKISLLGAFSILGFTFLAYLTPLPALLGSHEVIQSFIFPIYGFKPGAGTAFTLTLRSGDLLVAFLGLAFLLHSWSGILFEFLKIKFKIGKKKSMIK